MYSLALTIASLRLPRPSYSPDASLETAYNLINQAWNAVYRNSSGLPAMCAGLTGAGSNATTQFGCPRCVASMRLVSFTGGTRGSHIYCTF